MFSVPFSWPTPASGNLDCVVQSPHCSDEDIKREEKGEFVKDKSGRDPGFWQPGLEVLSPM